MKNRPAVKQTPKKKCLVFPSRALCDKMEQHLIKTGCKIYCNDWDNGWFLIYSEPA